LTTCVAPRSSHAGDLKPAAAAAAAAAGPTRVISLLNMVAEQDVADDVDYQEILEDTAEECKQYVREATAHPPPPPPTAATARPSPSTAAVPRFGEVVAVTIPRKGAPGTGKVFVEFSDCDAATKALQALAGRTFDGRRVEVTYLAEAKMKAGDFS